MKSLRYFILLLLSNFPLALFCQIGINENYFRAPLAIPIITSGNFGEIRSNHFHTGIDYKTQGTEGLAVYAVADGYVSRIKISSAGYGNALYITHPNGLVSVYAHLKEYNQQINLFVKQEQYKQESFTIDIALDSNKIKVKKGEIIAFSGNSGYSFGAHLHFELRESSSEKVENPLLYGFKIKDNTAPVIKSIKIYPISNNSSVDNSTIPITYLVNGLNKSYHLQSNNTINVSGNIAFGIEAFDLADGVSNKKGVYSIQLLVDSTCYFYLLLDKIDFNENLLINDLIDYKEFVTSKKKIIQTKKAFNNNFAGYKLIKNNGIVEFYDNNVHEITYILRDEKQNTSKLTFKVKNSLTNPVKKNQIDALCDDMLFYNKAKRIEKSNIIIDFPENSIFDSLCFVFSQQEKTLYSATPVYCLHNKFTPVLTPFTLSIKIDKLQDKYAEKYVIAKIEDNNKLKTFESKLINGFVTAKVSEFGNYSVFIDTISPEIKPINISEGANMKNNEAIIIKIVDKLSGIAFFKGTINKNWVIMEYDEKNDLIKYNFDNNKTLQGKNLFEIEVSDKCGNISKYKVWFIR